jgi:hypothetical protein
VGSAELWARCSCTIGIMVGTVRQTPSTTVYRNGQ